MSWQNRIQSDPSVCHGKPCIRGTRVMVSVVLSNVAAGEPWEAIAAGYHIDREDIQAALHYAAALTQDQHLVLPQAA